MGTISALSRSMLTYAQSVYGVAAPRGVSRGETSSASIEQIFKDERVRSGAHARKAGSPAATLHQLAQDYFAAYFSLNPEAAMAKGIPGYDDRLTSRSDEAVAEKRTLASQTLSALKQIPLAGLSKAQRFDHALFSVWLQGEIRDADDGLHHKRPDFYGTDTTENIFNHFLYPSESPEKDVESIVKKLFQIPLRVQEGMANIGLNAINVPSLWVTTQIEDLPKTIAFLKEALPSHYADVLNANPELNAALQFGIQTATTALNHYQSYLSNTILPAAHGNFAVGRDRLAEDLRKKFFVGVSPEELMAWAKSQAFVTRQKMEQLAEEISPGKTAAEIIEEMGDEHPPAEELLEAYRKTTMQAQRHLMTHDMVTLPKQDQIDVIPTPGFLQPKFPTAAYAFPQAFAKVSRGTFMVTIPDPELEHRNQEEYDARLRMHHPYNIRNYVVHEAYPGHHVQSSIAREIKESPLLHLLSSLMFEGSLSKVEGWGLLSEQVMVETGFAESPKDELLLLKWLLHRQNRVVIGLGLHTGLFTAKTAANYFVNHEPALLRSTAEAEIRNGSKYPLLLPSYAIGHRGLVSLREKLKEAMGDGFSLKAYHDAVLHTGNLPIGLVSRQIEAAMLKKRSAHG